MRPETRFKLTTMAGAVMAAVNYGLPTDALALNPATWTNGSVQVRLSGATAQDGGVEALMRTSGVCVPNTMDAFVLPAGTVGANKATFAYFCTPAAGLGLTGAPTQLTVFKQSGGSGDGIGIVANSTNTDYVNMAAVAANYLASSNICGATPTVVPADGSLSAYNKWTPCNGVALTSTFGDGGLADVEPQLLTASAADISKLKSQGANQVIFGVGVTLQLYRALQTAQSLALTDTEATMPSLTRSQIASLFQDGTGVDTWAAVNGLTSLPTDSTVYVARRVTTSGTQTFAEAYFLAGGPVKKCSATGQSFRAINSASTALNCAVLAGPVMGGSGNIDVANCLGQLDTNLGVNARWGIGILTTECFPTATGASCPPSTVTTAGKFRFIKIDGFAPTQQNVFRGHYTYVSEGSFNYRQAPAINLPTGNVLTMLEAIRTKLGDPAVIASVNNTYNPQLQGFNAGLMGITNDGSACPDPTVTPATLATSPVDAWSKSSTGTLTNCAPARQTCVLPTQ